MKKLCFVFTLFLTFDSWAGVFKCVEASGHIYYQSSPCTSEHQAVQINPKTGATLDLNELEQQKALNAEQKKQQELQELAEKNAKIEKFAQIKQQAKAEIKVTQDLIKENPLQFSAYAIPAYDPDNLPERIKPFESVLPEVEKYRRKAAQKALATGKCQRVEADELNGKSKPDSLVFLINCSSGSNFYFNQAELN
ncbi:DUF4124 domain-containing protein [Methylomonas sp. AM2-LC]|uniref:DUF4124 domain-containing protein n=1 Tax=Methylomonas sp. AM2-LC TaxID=3153301 RepID=UPI00326379D1